MGHTKLNSPLHGAGGLRRLLRWCGVVGWLVLAVAFVPGRAGAQNPDEVRLLIEDVGATVDYPYADFGSEVAVFSGATVNCLVDSDPDGLFTASDLLCDSAIDGSLQITPPPTTLSPPPVTISYGGLGIGISAGTTTTDITLNFTGVSPAQMETFLQSIQYKASVLSETNKEEVSIEITVTAATDAGSTVYTNTTNLSVDTQEVTVRHTNVPLNLGL